VRYEAVNLMLLNEFHKERRKIQEQKATIARQGRKIQEEEEAVTQPEKRMKNAAVRLEEKRAQIQKVSAELATASPSNWRT